MNHFGYGYGEESTVATRSSGEVKASREDPILRHWHEAAPDDYLVHLVKDAAHAVARRLQMRLVQREVSFGHWALLHILRTIGGLTQKELNGETGMTTPTTFNTVSTMKELGYAKRHHAPGNRKNTHVYLTARDRSLKNKLVPLAEEVNEVSVRGLKATGINIVRKALLTIIENIAHDEAETDDSALRIPSTRGMGSPIASRGEE